VRPFPAFEGSEVKEESQKKKSATCSGCRGINLAALEKMLDQPFKRKRDCAREKNAPYRGGEKKNMQPGDGEKVKND